MMKTISDEEEKPFLDQSQRIVVSADEQEFARSRQPHRFCQPWALLVLASIAVISLTSNLFLLLRLAASSDSTQARALQHVTPKPFSPADQFTAYELKSVNAHDPQDVFTGPPGPEFDRAWSNLLAAGFMRIEAEELRKAGKQSLRLKTSGEENYLGYMEVYHQLHCVKRMVQNRWPEKYPELHAMHAFSDKHFNHCIQVLRKGVMCNGDTSLNTFKWDENNSTQFVGISSAPRRCINWDLVDTWARSRAVGTQFELYSQGEEGWWGPK